MHYGIKLWAYLSQTHKPIALHCMHYAGLEPVILDWYAGH